MHCNTMQTTGVDFLEVCQAFSIYFLSPFGRLPGYSILRSPPFSSVLFFSLSSGVAVPKEQCRTCDDADSLVFQKGHWAETHAGPPAGNLVAVHTNAVWCPAGTGTRGAGCPGSWDLWVWGQVNLEVCRYTNC